MPIHIPDIDRPGCQSALPPIPEEVMQRCMKEYRLTDSAAVRNNIGLVWHKAEGALKSLLAQTDLEIPQKVIEAIVMDVIESSAFLTEGPDLWDDNDISVACQRAILMALKDWPGR